MSERNDIDILRARLEGTRGREYWRSLEAVSETPEFKDFLHREFPQNASEWLDPVGRRGFLKLMGASLALAGVSACTRQPDEAIVPYVRQPEELVPGRPMFYATAMPFAGSGVGLLVESHEGRPTKIEGNPDHPSSRGAADLFAQAAILGLYDPDRSQTLTHLGDIRTFDAFAAAMKAVLDAQTATGGAGVRILTDTVASPTLAAQIDELLKRFPQAKWMQWEPYGRHNAREGSRLAFGEYVDAQYAVDKADLIVSLDADFLCTGAAGLKHARAFASRRRVDGTRAEISRFYAIESTPSNSGSKADHRLPLRASDIDGVAAVLANAIVNNGGVTNAPGGSAPFLQSVVADLQAAKGRSLVIAGDNLSPQSHAAVHAINQALGNVGTTVVYTQTAEARPANQRAGLQELVGEMNAGRVNLLLIIGTNPVYTAPVDLNFAAAMEKVTLRAHLGQHHDETAALCHWHVPQTHFLEEWSDVRSDDGTVSIVQPLIAPLYNGHSAHEVIAALGTGPRSGYELVRAFWGATPVPVAPAPVVQNAQPTTVASAPAAAASPSAAPTSTTQNAPAPGAPTPVPVTGPSLAPLGTPALTEFDRRWRRWLHDGVVPNTAFAPKTVTAGAPPAPPARQAQGLEVVFRPDPSVYDGRFANNAWLQELPKSLTKLTWDNAALIAAPTAARLALVSGDLVELKQGNRTLRVPVWIAPGHAPDTLTLHAGYGRTRAGRAANSIGFNVNVLRTAAAQDVLTGVALEKTGDSYELACTQDHWSLEGRNLIRVATVEQYNADPAFAAKQEHQQNLLSMYPDRSYEGYSWGMTIDQNVCTGCNACVVACQAENNVPVVGKAQVLNGREMHWLRVDRYYTGELDNPETYHQPMPCQQCEQAPCEVVCPVAATVHSDEGLNDMVYNRCVGTRYCSNNCPYKVRRFNFMLYSDWNTESIKLQRNPDVTVRSRGVMEKCTYCVQRINHARQAAKLEDRQIRDGDVVTACQATCPTDAIVFGNLNDPNSRVSQLKKTPRNYPLLAELNTRPRTTYLAVVRNPNTQLEPATAGASEEGH
jgi:molybdopterin-containing oxidoreductase family iron-sulfur binding subunit